MGGGYLDPEHHHPPQVPFKGCSGCSYPRAPLQGDTVKFFDYHQTKITGDCGNVVYSSGRTFGHEHHREDHCPPQAHYGGGSYPSPPVQGDTVRIYCEADPDYHLANINGHVGMAPANDSDPNQQWIMDTSWSLRFKDKAGFPAFALVNRGTGQALRHGEKENETVALGRYHPNAMNEKVLFTRSADVGKGYQCIRPMNNIHLNLDGGVRDGKHHDKLTEGAEVVLFKWNKKESQKWKISPILAGRTSLYPQLNEEEPQGHMVRIYCEANPDFFLAARGQLAVLALGDRNDPHQQWVKVDSWGLKVKDEVGYPSFALVNKATRQALKHGDKEWDKIYLTEYIHNKLDDSVLWTVSADVGHGYQCLRPVNNIHLNMDAKHADGKNGGVHDGNELILFSWKKQGNQKWKLQPLDLAGKSSLYPQLNEEEPQADMVRIYCEVNPDIFLAARGQLAMLALGDRNDPQLSEEEPQGHMVRIYCEANPDFFLAARGQLAVLALGDRNDPHQQWVKVDSCGLKVKDGSPSFALVNKATRQALKHGDKEWDQIYLTEYIHNKLDDSVVWTVSADVGHGYQCLRPVNNIHLNMDAKHADGKNGEIHDGNELILFSWKKQGNQKWKLQPLDCK